MNSVPSSELGRVGQMVGGKFRLDAMIGRGGMGSVWAATHMGLGHRVAIKLIAREFVRSAEALRRFDAEAKAAARLQSRHVVQVFDNGTLDDGTPFIAMELLSGENVSDRIAQRGPFSLAQTVEVLAQCCKALGRAHAAGIVHRDIKPDNIFLAREPDTDGDVVKILDFGVAKMTMGVESASQVTGTGALLGTPLFMSPEQIRGSRDCDHRSDLYSLGLVAYTMLTGQLAVGGDSFGDILVKICTEPLPSLLASAPALPYPMEAWFQRVCARDPASRCQSAQEFIETLRAAAGTAPAPTVAMVTPPLPTLQSEATLGGGHAPGGPAFAQSAAAVSVTAAGVPKRPLGPWVVVASLVVLFAVGGGVLLAVAPGHRDATVDGATAASASAGTGAGAAPSAALAPPAPLTGVTADAGIPATAVRARPAATAPAVPPLSPLSPAVSPAATLAAGAPPAVPVAPVAAAPPVPSPGAARPVVPAQPVTAAAPLPPAAPPPTVRPVPLPKPVATINVGY